AAGAVGAVVTRSDLSRFFGEQPAELLRDIKRSRSDAELREFNLRMRALTLDYLTGAAAVDWLAKLTGEADAAIVSRILASVADHRVGCWCFYGSSGRGESLTRVAPAVLVLVSDDEDVDAAR